LHKMTALRSSLSKIWNYKNSMEVSAVNLSLAQLPKMKFKTKYSSKIL